jgi:hypothetical protein
MRLKKRKTKRGSRKKRSNNKNLLIFRLTLNMNPEISGR